MSHRWRRYLGLSRTAALARWKGDMRRRERTRQVKRRLTFAWYVLAVLAAVLGGEVALQIWRAL